MTPEEQRALNYNLSRERQQFACRVRDFQLRGNDAAVRELTYRTEAVMREVTDEQQAKIRYRDDEEAC